MPGVTTKADKYVQFFLCFPGVKAAHKAKKRITGCTENK